MTLKFIPHSASLEYGDYLVSLSDSKMDTSKLSISKAIPKDNGHVPKYHVQYLKYENLPIHFQSVMFYSGGPRMGLNKNYQLLVSLTNEVRQKLRQIEDFAIANLNLPSPISEKWRQYSTTTGDEQPFKRLYDGPNLFMKLAPNVHLYNLDHIVDNKYQSFGESPPALGVGMYIVSFAVPSVYIGSHNSNPKVASLQLKIEQIVYRPIYAKECSIQPDLTDPQLPPADAPSVDSLIHQLFDEEKDTSAKNVRRRNKKNEVRKPDTVKTVIDSVVPPRN